ncbi:MAG: archease [Candidatus Nanohaloarchaeota archaeon]|nr:archease [Candidatus Nanohaloarchaeota archaeon]
MYGYKEHTADVVLYAEANSFKELLEELAKGFFYFFLEIDFLKEDVRITQSMQIEYEDYADLAVSYLNELLYNFEVHQQILWKIKSFNVQGSVAELILQGILYNPQKHPLKGAIPKAATYHRVKVEEKQGKWYAEVVLDI